MKVPYRINIKRDLNKYLTKKRGDTTRKKKKLNKSRAKLSIALWSRFLFLFFSSLSRNVLLVERGTVRIRRRKKGYIGNVLNADYNVTMLTVSYFRGNIKIV